MPRTGEAAFRREETAAARRAAAMEGTVISTGGGIILRPENMEILSATGTVYFLDRDPRDIANTELDGRPLLSGGRDRVFLLYDQRINLYRKYARYTVPSTTVDETVGLRPGPGAAGPGRALTEKERRPCPAARRGRETGACTDCP